MVMKNKTKNIRDNGVYMRLGLIFAAMVMLSGCSGGLSELKSLNPQADDFDSSLAAEYLAYADSESELGHRAVADHFADKGLAAYRHEAVLPDSPEPSQVPQAAARIQLLGAMTDDVKQAAPEQAARAQLLYDCWLTQSRDTNRKGLAPCGDEFVSAMNELQAVADDFVFGENLSHAIQFAEGSAELSSKAQAEIYAIASHTKGIANYNVLLTDHSASDNASQMLAAKRLSAIRHAFIKAGVEGGKVIHNNADATKEVLLSTDEMEHNAVEVTVRTSGGR